MSTPLPVPEGIICGARSELARGRAVLHFTDSKTGGGFTVPESKATPVQIAKAATKHRDSFDQGGFES